MFVLPFAAGNAEAKQAVEYVRVRRNSRTLCELQSAGVPPAAAGDVVSTLARTRPLVLRMAACGRAPPSVCQRYDPFISVGTFVHTANGRAQAFRPLLPGDVVSTLARTRPLVLQIAERGRAPPSV